MFQETVKGEVVAEWEEMQAWRKNQAGAKVDFEQTVMRLRALKYARQVTRPFLEALKTEQLAQVQAILCLASVPDQYRRGRPFDVKVLIVVDRDLAQFEKALEIARARAARPPLTQYGIRSELHIASYSDLTCQTELVEKTLYLYPKYRPRQYTASGSLEYWLEGGHLKELTEDCKVPMLANVAVDVAWVLQK